MSTSPTAARCVVAHKLLLSRIARIAVAALAAIAAENGLRTVDAQAADSGATIEINDFAFTPQTLTIPAGTTVTWVNNDEAPHTVRETGRGFKSGALETGGRFSYVFSTPGSFQYFCSLHPHMTATVVVEERHAGS